MSLPEIERMAFAVKADKDEYSHFFFHADRFLIIDLKNRKEVVAREYRPNPFAEYCQKNYESPAIIGEGKISEEEKNAYLKIGEMLKDCKYVAAKNFGNYATKYLKEAGADYIMMDKEPDDWINILIEAREYAGYRD